VRRVIVALLDGLRPDAVTPTTMPALCALGEAHTLATDARTIRPSVTVAALASIATGVSPDTHRLLNPGLDFLPRLSRLRPLARELGRMRRETVVVTTELPLTDWPLALSLAKAAGATRFVPAGRRARDTAAEARRTISRHDARLLFVYLPDGDRIGHRCGWMSPPYLEAATELDRAVAILSADLDETLLIVTADHGGGGVEATEHHHPHPLNERIPLVLAGPEVAGRHRLTGPVSLLDVPATVLWWLGHAVPQGYEGRPLVDAFVPTKALQAVSG
jgi:predicted AlkP superfamily pyrophosphatase or phosphodiesterase